MPLENFDKQLSWSDFNPRSGEPASGNEWAFIHPEISFSDPQLTRVRNAVSISEVTITIALVTADCWVFDNHTTTQLLRHEQVHYDIVAINARELYNTLIGLSAINTGALQRSLNQLKARLARQARTVDARYDTLTNHGINTAVQQAWESSVGAAKSNARGTLNDLP